MAAQMTRQEAREWATGEKCEHGHICCKVHEVKRSCGHVDHLHYSDRARFWKANSVHRNALCGECDVMAEQGIVILNNHFKVA